MVPHIYSPGIVIGVALLGVYCLLTAPLRRFGWLPADPAWSERVHVYFEQAA